VDARAIAPEHPRGIRHADDWIVVDERHPANVVDANLLGLGLSGHCTPLRATRSFVGSCARPSMGSLRAGSDTHMINATQQSPSQARCAPLMISRWQ
jgi:hypothetical protein